MLWTQRGTPTRIERGRPTPPVAQVPWQWGRVRDIDVQVIDAIADISFMRSRIASHRLDELSDALTIYDVANAQFVARRLLLEVLRTWTHYDDGEQDSV